MQETKPIQENFLRLKEMSSIIMPTFGLSIRRLGRGQNSNLESQRARLRVVVLEWPTIKSALYFLAGL